MGLARGNLGKFLPLFGAIKHARTGVEGQIRCRKKRCCNLYKLWRSRGIAGPYRGLFAAETEDGRALNTGTVLAAGRRQKVIAALE